MKPVGPLKTHNFQYMINHCVPALADVATKRLRDKCSAEFDRENVQSDRGKRYYVPYHKSIWNWQIREATDIGGDERCWRI